MINLTQDTLVRIASWKSSFAKVGTLEGFCSKSTFGMTIEQLRARGEQEAWTTFAGMMLCSDRGFYDEQQSQYKKAIVIANGDHVLIDGKEYEVFVSKYNSGEFPKNSDPISFIPVKG